MENNDHFYLIDCRLGVLSVPSPRMGVDFAPEVTGVRAAAPVGEPDVAKATPKDFEISACT